MIRVFAVIDWNEPGAAEADSALRPSTAPAVCYRFGGSLIEWNPVPGASTTVRPSIAPVVCYRFGGTLIDWNPPDAAAIALAARRPTKPQLLCYRFGGTIIDWNEPHCVDAVPTPTPAVVSAGGGAWWKDQEEEHANHARVRGALPGLAAVSGWSVPGTRVPAVAPRGAVQAESRISVPGCHAAVQGALPALVASDGSDSPLAREDELLLLELP